MKEDSIRIKGKTNEVVRPTNLMATVVEFNRLVPRMSLPTQVIWHVTKRRANLQRWHRMNLRRFSCQHGNERRQCSRRQNYWKTCVRVRGDNLNRGRGKDKASWPTTASAAEVDKRWRQTGQNRACRNKQFIDLMHGSLLLVNALVRLGIKIQIYDKSAISGYYMFWLNFYPPLLGARELYSEVELYIGNHQY